MSYRPTIWLLLSILCHSFCGGQDSAQMREQHTQIPTGVAAGLLVTRVNPVYPPLARQARIQGVVILKAFISKTGDMEDLQLVSGHPMLAPAAIEAVKQWKYRPYLLNGEPVNVETQVQVNFVLAGKATPANDAPENSVVTANPPDAVETLSNPSIGVHGGIGTIHTPNPTVDGQTRGGAPGSMGGVIGAISSGPPQRIRVSNGVMRPLLLNKIDLIYPAAAKAQRIQGMVTLQVAIDKNGNVIDAHLINGHPLLAPAAIEAVKQWKYIPYLHDGNPVEVDTQVQVSFTLQE
jgi:TonB family protein